MKNQSKNINYIQILKNAWKITWENKFLWWFGFFVALGGGGVFNHNFNSSENNNAGEEIYPEIVEKMSYYWSMYSEWIITGIIILILIIFILCALGIIGRGGLINSLIEINKNNKTKFSFGFKKGKKFFWKLFVLNLILGIILILILAIFSFPIVSLLFAEAYGSAVLLSIIAIPIVISVFILVSFLRTYSQIYLVGNETRIVKSISLAYNILKKNIGKSVLMSIILMAVGIIIGIAIIIIILILSIPFIIWGIASFSTGSLNLVAIIITGLFSFVSYFIFKSAYIVFVQATWILFFNEIATSIINNPKKELQIETEKVSNLGHSEILSKKSSQNEKS